MPYAPKGPIGVKKITEPIPESTHLNYEEGKVFPVYVTK
jgi:hypothetical protein